MNVLFVCSANVARSPMAAAIFRDLAQDLGRHAVRSAGTAPGAVRPLTTRDLAWAHLVAVMEPAHLVEIRHQWPRHASKVRVLGVPDHYDPGESDLRALLLPKVRALVEELEAGRP